MSLTNRSWYLRISSSNATGSSSRYRTTIWSAPGVGPVRIDIDDADIVRSYVLTELDRPTTEPTGE